jgi:ABC-type molybdate transport system substrate-binding protein
MKTLLALAGAVTLCGCAFNRQYATTTSTNPTNGLVSVTVARSTTVAVGDTKTSIEKARASAGKTSSVGASGVNEETTSTNAVDLISTIVSAAVRAAVKP